LDSIVLFYILNYLEINNAFKKYIHMIFRVWLIGVLSYFVAAFVLFTISIGYFYQQYCLTNNMSFCDVSYYIDYYPTSSILAFLICVFAIAVSGFSIYLFNIKFSLKTIDLKLMEKRKAALALAIATVPYLILIPGGKFFDIFYTLYKLIFAS